MVIFSNYSLKTPVPNLVSLTCHSPNIMLDKIQTKVFSISGFLVKWVINKNSFNSRIINDIEAKLRPLSKLGERNTIPLKDFDNDFMLANYNVIIIFSIYSLFRTIQKSDSRCMRYNSWFLLPTFYLNWSDSKTKNALTKLSYHCFEKR